nr:uncharacterized protein LOC116809334 [Taeniopygia guttata]
MPVVEGGIHLCVLLDANRDFSPVLSGEEGPVRGISGSSSHGCIARMGSGGAAPWKGSKIKVVELTRLFVGTRSFWRDPLFLRQARPGGTESEQGKLGSLLPRVPLGSGLWRPRCPQGRVPLPLSAAVIYTISCPGKFRSLTLLAWFPLSCPAPFGSSRRAQQQPGRTARAGWRCQAGPGREVSPMSGRTTRAQLAWEGWKTSPVSIPPAQPRCGTGQGRQEEGGRARAWLQSFWVPAELTPSPLPPHPSRLACVSPPFPSPSHPAANKMAAPWPFCFPSGRGKPGRWDLALFWRLRPCPSPTLPSLRGTGCSKREKGKKKREKKKKRTFWNETKGRGREWVVLAYVEH